MNLELMMRLKEAIQNIYQILQYFYYNLNNKLQVIVISIDDNYN